jgi:hypothetical protein
MTVNSTFLNIMTKLNYRDKFHDIWCILLTKLGETSHSGGQKQNKNGMNIKIE